MKNRKTLKTLLCASSSLMMAMAAISPVTTSVIPVMATDPAGMAETEGTITIHDMPGNTSYDVYQLFTGEWTTGGKFVNVKFADNRLENIILDAYKNASNSQNFTLNGNSADAKAAELAAAIGTLSAPSAKIKFANELAKLIKSSASGAELLATVANASEETADGSKTQAGLRTGYYILVPTTRDGSVSETTDAILYEAKKAEIEVYSKDTKGRPTPDKTVTGDGWKGGQFDLSYTITSTVSTNIADYTSYKFVVKDTLPKGLVTTADEIAADWKVNISFSDGTKNPVTLTADSTTVDTVSLDETATEDSNLNRQSIITWRFNDLIAAFESAGISKAEWKNQKITIKYSPNIDNDDKAAMFKPVANDLNPITNTVNVEYPNDPHAGGEGTSDQTTDETVDKYVYSLSISKVDDKLNALDGAVFTLTNEKTGDVTQAAQVDTGSKSTFLFTGLVAGTYTLKETPPAGYTAAAPIKLIITENNDVAANGFALSCTKADGTLIDKNEYQIEDGTSLKNSNIELQVTNKSNIGGLPITGEAGIMLGLGTGGVIIAISAVSMLRRKKEIEE